MDRVYLDAATSLPVRREVLEEMLPFFTEHFGNPSSIHELGRIPREAVERSRGHVASLISADPSEIVFTSGATESINLAMRGVLPFLKERRKVIISSVDHMSVRATASALTSGGYVVEYLPVDDVGRIDIGAAERMIDEETAVVSFPFASSEVGTVQPAGELASLAHSAGALSHVDLTMSALQMPVDVGECGVDMATLSSPDLMGPKGVGALFVRKGVKITSLIKGGGQERNLRSGSENVPGIVGMGAAARIAGERMEEDPARMRVLRDRLIEGLTSIPESYLNGDPENRLPNNANVRFSYIEGESMLLMLDMNGISVSTGSACAQKTLEASKTLLAMGLKHEEAHGSLIFTLNPMNTEHDIEKVIEVMPGIVSELRAMSPIYNMKE